MFNSLMSRSIGLEILPLLHSIMFYINVIDMQISNGCNIEFLSILDDYGSWYIFLLSMLD